MVDLSCPKYWRLRKKERKIYRPFLYRDIRVRVRFAKKVCSPVHFSTVFCSTACNVPPLPLALGTSKQSIISGFWGASGIWQMARRLNDRWLRQVTHTATLFYFSPFFAYPKKTRKEVRKRMCFTTLLSLLSNSPVYYELADGRGWTKRGVAWLADQQPVFHGYLIRITAV